jgi:UDP-N-acetylglucosamine 4,6-dehydratase
LITFPIEATKTNVLGTHNVINSAIKYKISKVVCLSTDKAAYPINAMGISKALMEKVAIAASRDSRNTTICVTRYGNVMASRGSVIPLFVDKIKNNEDLTITEGSMTRFIMSLEEAVELVMYAFENGNSGDLFVQKSPACTIEDLAQALKNIFNSSVENKILGIRHGEKMYETLCTSEEMAKAIDLPGFYKIPPDERDLNYDRYFEEGIEKPSITEYNSNNTTQLSIEEIEKKLLTLSFIREKL